MKAIKKNQQHPSNPILQRNLRSIQKLAKTKQLNLILHRCLNQDLSLWIFLNSSYNSRFVDLETFPLVLDKELNMDCSSKSAKIDQPITQTFEITTKADSKLSWTLLPPSSPKFTLSFTPSSGAISPVSQSHTMQSLNEL